MTGTPDEVGAPQTERAGRPTGVRPRAAEADPAMRAVGVAEPREVPGQRRIVTFARTDLRLQDKDARAIARYGDTYLVPVRREVAATSIDPALRFDHEQVFGHVQPLVVEIGSGSGDAVVAGAQAWPDHDVLGMEVYRPGLFDMLRKVGSRGLDNVRLLEADAVHAFETYLPEGSVTEVWTFFPDPWPKTKHHKRRLVAPAMADLVAKALAPGGRWRLATDWEDYAEQMMAVLTEHPAFENAHGEGGWAPRFDVRPLTRFERRGMAAGRTIRDLTFTRV